MIHTAETYRELATYKHANMSLQAAYWKEAMAKEYDSLIDNHTWILVAPAFGRKLIQCNRFTGSSIPLNAPLINTKQD